MEGGGVQNKKPSVGEYGYFLELHNVDLKCPSHPESLQVLSSLLGEGGGGDSD